MKTLVLRTVAIDLLASLSMLAYPCLTPGQTTAPPSPRRSPSEQPADAAEIERFIQQLGSDRFAEREAASKALDTLGEPAWVSLRKAQDHSDLEIRRRAHALVQILRRRRAPKRAEAWTAIKELGGRIDSDTSTPEGKIGVIEFYDVQELRADDLALLLWFDEVRGIAIKVRSIDNAGLVHLKKCFQLEILDFECANITDAGLEHIGAVKTLHDLSLCDTKVTDAGLVHLKGLKLWYLNLSWTQVTDEGLEHLKGMNTFPWGLNLAHTQVTDVGLAKLKNLNLGSLNLSKTQITDAGLTQLKELQNLQDLDLSDTQITDAGLAHLKKIRTLKILRTERTKVTDRGKAEWFAEVIKRAKPSRPKQAHGTK